MNLGELAYQIGREISKKTNELGVIVILHDPNEQENAYASNMEPFNSIEIIKEILDNMARRN